MIAEQRDESHYRYRIDALDRLTDVDDAWLAFAVENDTTSLTATAVIGKSLWHYIDGPYTRQLYQVLFERVRQTKQTVIIPFRCDSPTLRRDMNLSITPGENNELHFDGTLLRTAETEPNPLLNTRARRSQTMLSMCSFCKAVEIHPNEWIQPEIAVARLKLFDESDAPQISHGVCNDCVGEFNRRMEL